MTRRLALASVFLLVSALVGCGNGEIVPGAATPNGPAAVSTPAPTPSPTPTPTPSP